MKTLIKRGLFLILVLGVTIPTGLYAQTYVTNGTATALGGDRFRLTEALNGSSGSVWYQNLIVLTSDFDLEFKIYLGNKNGNGADG